jgi:prepilin signal peptidase PulO-like enzyme (type II secretory pathway)
LLSPWLRAKTHQTAIFKIKSNKKVTVGEISYAQKSYLKCFMDNPKANAPKSAWKGRLLKFVIYLVIGFLVAFLYRQLKK